MAKRGRPKRRHPALTAAQVELLNAVRDAGRLHVRGMRFKSARVLKRLGFVSFADTGNDGLLPGGPPTWATVELAPPT